MPREFDPYQLLPRHVRKLLNNKNGMTSLPEYHSGKVTALDKNESPWGTVGIDADYHRFPDAQAQLLRQELAEYYKVAPPKIALGNGADELIDLLLRGFCTSGKDHILALSPHEPRLKQMSLLNGLVIEELALNAFFQMSIFQARNHFTEQTKILYMANPNPVSGVLLRGIDMVDLIEDFQGIVIIDETYIEYAENDSLLEYLDTYPNLVIIRSFDHAWGMAGLRLGLAFASEQIVEILNKIRPPFNINTVAQEVAVKALRVPEQKDRIVAEVVQERHKLKEALRQLKFVEEVYDSEANFLLIRVEKPEQVLQYLKEERLIACDVSHLHLCQGCLRLGIGLPEQNQQLLKSLRELPSKTAPARVFFRKLGQSLQKASMFLGFFKKIIG